MSENENRRYGVSVANKRVYISTDNIDKVLLGGYNAGIIDSWLLHELDHRLKYEPDRPWTKEHDIKKVEGKFSIGRL